MKKLYSFIIVVVIFFISGCSKDKIEEEEFELADRKSDWTVELAENSEEPNTLIGRVINPDYKFSFFSNENGTGISSYIYESNTSKFQILIPKLSTNKFICFPIENEQISPLGFEYIVNDGIVNQINLVELNSSTNEYLILENIYTNLDFIKFAQSSNIQQTRNQEISIEELDKQIEETVNTLTGYSIIKSITDFSEEVKSKLENLPNSISNEYNYWKNYLKDLINDISQSSKDLEDYQEERNLENTVTEELEEDTETVIEQKVEEQAQAEDEIEIDLSQFNYVQFDRTGVVLKLPIPKVNICDMPKEYMDIVEAEWEKKFAFTVFNYDVCSEWGVNGETEQQIIMQQMNEERDSNPYYYYFILQKFLQEGDPEVYNSVNGGWFRHTAISKISINRDNKAFIAVLNHHLDDEDESKMWRMTAPILNANELIIKFPRIELHGQDFNIFRTYNTSGTIHLRKN